MSEFELIIHRLAKALLMCLLVVLGFGSCLAAVGELDIPLQYKSRVVPPLELPHYPGGLSAIKADSYLLKFNNTAFSWSVNIPIDDNYVSLTLYAGDYPLYSPLTISLSSYVNYDIHTKMMRNWVGDMASYSGTKGNTKEAEGINIPIINIPPQFENWIGTGGARINVSGSRKISFSGKSQWDDLTETGTFKQSKFPSLHMEQTSKFKIKGEIGSKITVEVDQDSNRDVDIANTLKLRYKGGEDEIIQSIEAGNTNLTLPNSRFIGFSQSVQGLFGIKATAKIGNVDLTMITSQEKGSTEKSSFTAGAQASADTIWDYQYLHNVYFWLRDPDSVAAYSTPGSVVDSLIDVKLYRSGSAQDLYGLACVDPHYGPGADETGGLDTMFFATSEQENSGEVERRYYQLIPETDYQIYFNGWYLILNQPLAETDVLAAYIKYVHKTGLGPPEMRQEGRLSSSPADTLVLKLIRDPDTDASFYTWNYEWKNVYDLGVRDLTSEGFKLMIYKGIGSENDVDDQGGQRFIQLFGFDQYNNSNGAPPADGIFDFNTATDIDAARGHLRFHQREPFIADFLNVKNTAIYDSRYTSNDPRDSKAYYIYVESAKRSSTFSLGRTNIIEGSEVVKMSDGRMLKRGVDYNIVYEIGQITFLNEDALNAAADISVDYEYSPFFLPEKKSLFGLSADYQISDKSFFSLAGMYRKESAQDYRPQVGREPKRSLIWDSNLVLHFDPEFITSAVDALPLIETDAPSSIEFNGEVAQSFPNPNIKNDAYIDDFEGTKEYTDLVMRRGVWTMASPPVGKDLADRRTFRWYNPFEPVTLRSIWPEKSVESKDDRQDVMILEYNPDTTGGPDTQGWGGIMRPMFSGISDHSRTKFVEIWYHPDSNSVAQPMLYIDAGKITEDLNGDGYKNTEDRAITGQGDRNRGVNGVFDPDEDTGLDTLTDEQEIAYYTQMGWPFAYPDDPAGDDWYYDGNADPDNFTRVNGTEGNRDDPDRLNRMDTEDINNNGSLDQTNAYFEYAIDLSDDRYVEETTSKGWKLLRIPFQDSSAYTTVGNPDFEVINFVRMWMAGVPNRYKLYLASVQLVGNKWQTLGPPDPFGFNGITINPKVEVTVKNTQEHANSYQSPPGVYGEYNRDTGVQEKEQSLVLQYENLYPGQQVGAFWSLLQPQDYTLYQKMKMYVHGDESLTSSQPVTFFFRVGTDSTNNFYEYRTKLYPGWDTRNYVAMDFAEMTALKSYAQLYHPDSVAYIDTTAGSYRVKGNPSLSTVKIFVMGIEYDSLQIDTTFYAGDSISVDTTVTDEMPLAGEVWADELVLTDVRRNSDFAGRFEVKLGLADFGNVSVQYSKTGADFFKLTAVKPEGMETTQKSLSTQFNADKLVPPSWGFRLPLTLTWQNNLQLPKFKTGSDIILPAELRDKEKTDNSTFSVTANESFNKNTKNWLFNLTLNRIQTRYVFTRKNSSSPLTPINNATNFEIGSRYDLTPKVKPSFMPFGWAKYLFLPKSIYETKFFYMPTALRFEGTVKGTKQYTKNNRELETSTYSKDFTGIQTYGITPFSALKIDFTSSTLRDISYPGAVAFALNPRDIQIGREKDYKHTFDVSFTPRISPQLSPRVTYRAQYADNSDLARNPDSTRASRLDGSIRGDVSLDVFGILGLKKFFQNSGQQSGNRFINNIPGRDKSGKNDIGDDKEPKPENDQEVGEDEETGEDTSQKKHFKIPNPVKAFRRTFSFMGTVKPVKANISSDKGLTRAGLYKRPGWGYTLGFYDRPDVSRKVEETSYVKDQITRTLDYSLQSGLAPFSNLDFNIYYKARNSVQRSSTNPTPTETNSVEFPRMDGRLTNLSRLPLLKKLTKTAELQSGYSKKVDDTGNADTGELNTRSTNYGFSPFLALNFTLQNDIRIDIRYDKSKTKSEQLRQEGTSQRVDFDENRTFKVSVSYSLTAPQGLKIPIFGKVKFNSQLQIVVDVSKKYTKSWFIIENDKTTDADTKELSIDPRLTYRFSAKVTGGLTAKWADSKDSYQNRNRHTRELGIWTEIRF